MRAAVVLVRDVLPARDGVRFARVLRQWETRERVSVGAPVYILPCGRGGTVFPGALGEERFERLSLAGLNAEGDGVDHVEGLGLAGLGIESYGVDRGLYASWFGLV